MQSTILTILLQISTEANTAELINDATTQSPSISLIDLIIKGGVVMIPLAILSVIAIYIFVERLLTIKAASKTPNNFVNSLKPMLANGDIEGVKAACNNANSPISRMILKGISRLGRPIKEIESAIETTGKLETSSLEKNLGILGIIAAIAPMFGFVGTIIGVIKIFYNISLADNISIGLIAGGLYEKMVTSATGLIVGIIAHFGYHFLNHMIDNLVFKMEVSATEFVDAINDVK